MEEGESVRNNGERLRRLRHRHRRTEAVESLGFPAVAASRVNATGLNFSHENVERERENARVDCL